MKKLLTFAFVLITAGLFLAGCGDSNVTMVKEGTMNFSPDAKIGDILSSRFTDTSWESSKEDGRTYVRFHGKVSEKLHKKIVDKVGPYISATTDYDKKRDKVFDEKINPLLNKLPHEKYEKQKKIILKKFHEDYLTQLFPVGAEISMEWIIQPNNKGFKLTAVTNEGLVPGSELEPERVAQYVFER